uniref:Uncharacterized protein n=1 Tax=Globodera rostochiensis TaxID=31243 RepID=A0A914I955_GLORO
MGISNSVMVVFALLTALTLPGLSWGDDSASAPPILEGCKKKAAECTKCDWGDCHSSSGFASDGCCSAGHQFKCCENAPEVLTPCEKMMAKCDDNWGECFPRDGYKGDACCHEGASFKCVYEMTLQERASKDSAYAKLINCFLAGHPDLESLRKCVPRPSECKSPSMCRTDHWYFQKCPKFVKCLQRKHSDIDALLNCWPNDDNMEECNAPLPSIENATEA